MFHKVHKNLMDYVLITVRYESLPSIFTVQKKDYVCIVLRVNCNSKSRSTNNIPCHQVQHLDHLSV